MDRVGAYEAKTHLPRLLDRVERGETIEITRHGVPVAVLRPADPELAESIDGTVAALRSFRRGRRLGDATLRELIVEGRR